LSTVGEEERVERKRESSEVWEPMRLRYVGDVGDVVQMTKGQGQGKTAAGHDTGDIFKPPGQG
jgi:hypothetical protein